MQINQTIALLTALLSCSTVGLAQLVAGKKPISQPLMSTIYTADPSAHVFGGKIYIYPSHDIETGVKEDTDGGRFDMKDYHVLSMDKIGGKVIDNGAALDISDVPWATQQLWAPDAAYKKGTYYLYFPARDKQGIFRIGSPRVKNQPARSPTREWY